jgi:hypothetical protein
LEEELNKEGAALEYRQAGMTEPRRLAALTLAPQPLSQIGERIVLSQLGPSFSATAGCCIPAQEQSKLAACLILVFT